MKSRAAEFMAVEECAVIITEWRASHVYFVSLTITATVSVYGWCDVGRAQDRRRLCTRTVKSSAAGDEAPRRIQCRGAGPNIRRQRSGRRAVTVRVSRVFQLFFCTSVNLTCCFIDVMSSLWLYLWLRDTFGCGKHCTLLQPESLLQWTVIH